MIDTLDVVTEDEVLFSGARVGSSNQGRGGGGGRQSGKRQSPAQKAAATRRARARAGMSAAEKARDTRAFNSGTGKYAKKKKKAKKAAAAAPRKIKKAANTPRTVGKRPGKKKKR